MKTLSSIILTLAVVAAATIPTRSFAAEKLSDEELRKEVQELRSLPPEERRVKQRELVEKISPEQREKLRERLQTLRPAGPGGTNVQAMTPEQREARMKQGREMLATRIADLEKKQADGTITDEEKQQLARAKQAQERLKNGQPPLLGRGNAAEANPEQRASQVQALRDRAEKRLGDLEKKKADGTLTAEEETQLTRLKAMQARQKNSGKAPDAK
jgi:hypothetical protein